MDTLTPEERSKNMSAIKNANTKPELYIRKLLFADGYRYRIQARNIPGHPDIWMKKYNTAIFVNGCFWHRHKNCKYAYSPKSRVDFWNAKFEHNVQRDEVVRQELKNKGIRCLIIWECSVKAVQKKDGNPDQLLLKIKEFLNSQETFQEL